MTAKQNNDGLPNFMLNFSGVAPSSTTAGGLVVLEDSSTSSAMSSSVADSGFPSLTVPATPSSASSHELVVVVVSSPAPTDLSPESRSLPAPTLPSAPKSSIGASSPAAFWASSSDSCLQPGLQQPFLHVGFGHVVQGPSGLISRHLQAAQSVLTQSSAWIQEQSKACRGWNASSCSVGWFQRATAAAPPAARDKPIMALTATFARLMLALACSLAA
mmetsp:Transcript_77881/g.152882  ORF Transcript_77881/g.152882 Transcript_77881/m.152882 type:complete len:217 (-) Transcript_77881:159-809(-)